MLDVQRTICHHAAMTTVEETTSAERRKYRDKRAERFATGERAREFPAFERQAYRRLELLDAAPNKEALILLPSNHFEAIGGQRKSTYSICTAAWSMGWHWTRNLAQPAKVL